MSNCHKFAESLSFLTGVHSRSIFDDPEDIFTASKEQVKIPVLQLEILDITGISNGLFHCH
jgi:hypothetical protein